MRISVIIPTYNSGPLVVEAVESVLAQTLPVAEIIVVDDGSTDDTKERLERFSDRVVYLWQENQRVAAARNAGLDRATGDLVAFLDADDAWHPEKLAQQVAEMERRPEIGLLATECMPWPGAFASVAAESAQPGHKIELDEMLLKNPIATSSVLIRRTVVDRIGRFDRELFGPEDYDFWLRAAQVSCVAILTQRLTGYRDTVGSLGKQAATMHRGLLRIHEKLSDAGVWGSRGWLRQKCEAHVEYTTGYLYYAGGLPKRAVSSLLRSFWKYPLPMHPPDVRCRFARTRLLIRSSFSAMTNQ
jgi:glycosyltransferase involved in cell wall biosynthesis